MCAFHFILRVDDSTKAPTDLCTGQQKSNHTGQSYFIVPANENSPVITDVSALPLNFAVPQAPV